MELVFKLHHQIIRRADQNVIAANARNYVRAKFEFLSEDWTVPVTAIFNEYTVVLDENGQCFVPWEVLTQPGQFQVSAFCGDLHTATSISVPVYPSGYTEGQTPKPPTPNIYLQLTGLVQTAVDTANNVKQRADSGEFNGADAPQIDDSTPSAEHPWSGEKIHQELSHIQEQVDYLLGKNSPTTFQEVMQAVAIGLADNYFKIGDQLKTTWSDLSTSFEDPFDIVQMNQTYTLENGTVINGMMLQQHYANTKGCPFDPQEALYDAEEELPAGTYCFTVAGDTWLPSENGKSLQFTLTKPLPRGGQLVYSDTDGFNKTLAGQKISTYAGPTSFDPIESVVLTEGNAGTNLGETNGKGNLNHHQRAFRGSGRWKTSMLRQYLNSDKPAGQWWSKQEKWDRASAFHTSCPGYLSGFDPEFLAAIKPVKVQTVQDTVVHNGEMDITFDRFFPISLEQLNAVAHIEGVEGDALDYWKEMASHDTTANLDNGRFRRYGTYPMLVTSDLSTKESSRSCWLRSANLGYSYDDWYISASGNLASGSVLSSYSCAPACVIG